MIFSRVWVYLAWFLHPIGLIGQHFFASARVKLVKIFPLGLAYNAWNLHLAWLIGHDFCSCWPLGLLGMMFKNTFGARFWSLVTVLIFLVSQSQAMQMNANESILRGWHDFDKHLKHLRWRIGISIGINNTDCRVIVLEIWWVWSSPYNVTLSWSEDDCKVAN